jgi:hypothetical protein
LWSKEKSLAPSRNLGFLLGLLFNPEEGNMFLRNVDGLSTDYVTLYLRRQNSSKWKKISKEAIVT